MGIRRSIMGFDQEEVLKLKKTITKEIRGVEKQVEIKLDLQDLLILKQIADFPNRKAITKVIIQDEIFFWVSYKQLIEELPILDIGKQALSDRLDKMSKLGLLKRTFQTIGGNSNMTFFKMGDAYEGLRYKKDESQYEECKAEGYRSQIREGIVVEHDTCCSQLRDINIPVDKELVLELVGKENKDKSLFEKKDSFQPQIAAEDKVGYTKKRKFEYDLSFVEDDGMREVMRDWLEYKKDNKQGYKNQRALKALYTKIINLSGGSVEKARAIIENSMANNYSGLFELREQYNQPQKPKQKTEEEKRMELLTLPIIDKENGTLADGTFVKNGYRYYHSLRENRACSCAMNSPIRPNDRCEWDAMRCVWYVPREEWDASDEMW